MSFQGSLLSIALLILSWSLVCNANGPFFGGFSLFSPKKLSIQAHRVLQQDVVKPKKFSHEISGEKEIILDSYDYSSFGTDVLRFVLQAERIEKYRRITHKSPFTQLSIASWPIGWRNYLFHTTLNKGKSPKDLGSLEFNSIDTNRRGKTLQISFRLAVDNHSRVYFQAFANYSRMETKEVELVVDELSHFLRPMLREAHLVLQSRHSLHREHIEKSRRSKAIKKEKALDTIINPEKYRTKVCRRPSGNGRYSPSDATRARRQVVRKGG